MAKIKQTKLKHNLSSAKSLATRHGVRQVSQTAPHTASSEPVLLGTITNITNPKPRSAALSAAARTSLTTLVKELQATEQQVRDLNTAHEKELADIIANHQREIFELEDFHARELGEQENEFDETREETEVEIEELKDELDEKEEEIDNLEWSLRTATADVERLEKEIKAKDTDTEKQQQQETMIQRLERELAQEKAKNSELARAKIQLDKVQKQWANMAKLFSGQDQHVGVDDSGDDKRPKDEENDENDEDEMTVVEY
jgi:chromosome segregation ATPase